MGPGTNTCRMHGCILHLHQKYQVILGLDSCIFQSCSKVGSKVVCTKYIIYNLSSVFIIYIILIMYPQYMGNFYKLLGNAMDNFRSDQLRYEFCYCRFCQLSMNISRISGKLGPNRITTTSVSLQRLRFSSGFQKSGWWFQLFWQIQIRMNIKTSSKPPSFCIVST